MLVLPDGANENSEKISPYLLVAPRMLRDVCRATRRDDDGAACPQCCVRVFCETQARRAGGEAAD